MLSKEQKTELEEERIRLLFARHGKSNPEVEAWIKTHGSVPKPKMPAKVETQGSASVVVTEVQGKIKPHADKTE